MTQEALKKMYQLLLTEPHAPTVCAQLERIAREALADHAMQEVQRLGQEIEQEPVAWIHIMDNTEGIRANGKGIISITQKRKHPFGKVGIDFDPSYPIKSTPLYTAPPQRKPLTDKAITQVIDSMPKKMKGFGVDWDLYEFARAIEAKPKENT